MAADSASNLRAGIAPIRLSTPLMLEVKGAGARLATTLVGVIGERYWIVDQPRHADGDERMLLVGDLVVVRYLFEGTAYGFQARVLSIIHEPEHVVFLTYPRELVERSLRQSRRLACFMPALLETTDEGLLCAIRDISPSGCQCLLKRRDGAAPEAQLPPGARVTVVFPLVGFDGDQRFPGEVVRRYDHEGRLAVGVRFDELHHEGQYRVIERLIAVE